MNIGKEMIVLGVLLIIVLIIFGPNQLPKLGKMIGGSMKSVRDGMEGIGSEEEEEAAKPKAVEAAAPTETPAKKPASKDIEAL
jgi:sec-independent protein translocase protein TatA